MVVRYRKADGNSSELAKNEVNVWSSYGCWNGGCE